jgi:hypothetical protein
MHSTELKHEFLQLRTRGATLSEISELLQVPASTLGVWNRQLRPEINRLRALEWELFEAQFGCSLEDNLKTLAKRIRRFEDALDKLPVKSFYVDDWLRIIQHTRRDYLKLRSILLAPLDEPKTKRRLLPRPAPPPAELYKIVRPDDSPESQPHNDNDLQQPAPAPSTSLVAPPPQNSTNMVADANVWTKANERSQAVPSPGAADEVSPSNNSSLGQAEGVSSESSDNPAPQPADAVQDSANPEGGATCSHGASQFQPADTVHGSPTPSASTIAKLIVALGRLAPDTSNVNSSSSVSPPSHDQISQPQTQPAAGPAFH